MKLIYVAATLPFPAGAEDFFIPEVKELVRQGHKLLIVPRSPRGVVSPGDPSSLLTTTLAKPLFSAGIIGWAALELARRPVECLRVLRLLLRSGDVRTTLKNLAVLPKGLWLARTARKWGATHIHAQWAATTASMAFIAGEVSGIPWSFTAHRGDIVQNNLLAAKVQAACFVRFSCKAGMELAWQRCGEALQEKAKVIHMGVHVPPTAAPEVASPAASIIFCPANLRPVKGHLYLLQAVAILRDRGLACELRLAGEGHLREALEKQVSNLSIGDRVTFLGRIPHHADLLELYEYGRVGMVVLPSVDLRNGLHEGIPVSLIEAMSYGIPVISTTTGGIPELLSGGAGLLVPPQDPLALANAIQCLVQDSDLRAQIAQAGRKRVTDQFAIERAVSEFVACVAEC